MKLYLDHELLQHLERISKKFAASRDLCISEEELCLVRQLKQQASGMTSMPHVALTDLLFPLK